MFFSPDTKDWGPLAGFIPGAGALCLPAPGAGALGLPPPSIESSQGFLGDGPGVPGPRPGAPGERVSSPENQLFPTNQSRPYPHPSREVNDSPGTQAATPEIRRVSGAGRTRTVLRSRAEVRAGRGTRSQRKDRSQLMPQQLGASHGTPN